MLKKMMSIGLCLGLCLWLTVPAAAEMTYEEQEALQDYFKKNDQIREFGAKPLDLLNNPKYKLFFEQYGNALLVIRIANEYNLNKNWEAAKLIFEKLAEKRIKKLSPEFEDVFGWFSFVKTGLELFKTFYFDPELEQYNLDFYTSARHNHQSPEDAFAHLKAFGHLRNMALERFKNEYGPLVFREDGTLLPRWEPKLMHFANAWFESQYQLRLAREAVARAKIVKSNKDRELLALLQKSDGMGTNYSIRVMAGTYGGNCGQPRGNKTEHLAKACNGRSQCVYTVDHKVIGDPAYGCVKNYVAEWQCGSSPAVLRAEAPGSGEAGYGSKVTLSCGTGNPQGHQ